MANKFLMFAVAFLICFSAIIPAAPCAAYAAAGYSFDTWVTNGEFVFRFINYSDAEVGGVFFLGVYDTAGKLVGVESQALYAPKDGGFDIKRFSIKTTDYPGNFSFKAFCWDYNYVPLTQAVISPGILVEYITTGIAVVVDEPGVVYDSGLKGFCVADSVTEFMFVDAVGGVGAAYTAAYNAAGGWTITRNTKIMTIVRNTLLIESNLRGSILPETTKITLASGIDMLLVTIYGNVKYSMKELEQEITVNCQLSTVNYQGGASQ